MQATDKKVHGVCTSDYCLVIETEISTGLTAALKQILTDAQLWRPEAAQAMVQKSIAATLESYHITGTHKLITGNGASHIWISDEATKERAYLITFKNSY